MSESWRNILERAAENLAIDLDQMAAPAFSHVQAAPLGSRRLSPQLSFAESRELLARELQAFSAQSRAEAPMAPRLQVSTALTIPVTALKRRKELGRAPRKQTRWAGMVASCFSAALMGGLTAYLLLAQGDFRREAASIFAAYADQGAVSGEASALASASEAGVVNRSTEDTLLTRASYQLSKGDGEAARAVFEVLANRGSLRGAFALAETYDPAKLAQHANWGLKSDIRLARAWYKKASELGSLAAYERLKGLEKRAASLQPKAAQL